MAFALKASSTAHALSHPTRRGSSPAVLVATRGRLVVRAAAAAAPAPASSEPAVVLRAPPRVPAAFVPVADCSVARTLTRVKEQGKTAFIPYITAGDPDLATTAEALRLLDACGADVIEQAS